jgi:NAD-dependent dihydropyrimidine dehydrogenase PreA subunit
VPEPRFAALAGALRHASLPFVAVPDLCGLAARRDPDLLEWARHPGRKVVACHPRAIVNLFAAAGAPLPGDALTVNLRTDSAQAAAAQLGIEWDEGRGTRAQLPPSTPSSSTASPPPSDLGPRTSDLVPSPSSLLPSPSSSSASPPPWFPWFPVIDRARCTDCRQCLEFCLFGVYTLENGRIEVRHPENCKPHCPACARICPHTAIVFPKHTEAPIDGSPIADEEAEKARARRELNELLGQDIDAALAERRRRAAARLLDAGKLRLAMAERERCARKSGAEERT